MRHSLLWSDVKVSHINVQTKLESQAESALNWGGGEVLFLKNLLLKRGEERIFLYIKKKEASSQSCQSSSDQTKVDTVARILTTKLARLSSQLTSSKFFFETVVGNYGLFLLIYQLCTIAWQGNGIFTVALVAPLSHITYTYFLPSSAT